ncbi:hypothetical protein ACJQ65_004179, partial [Yersinia enterocolitica]
TNTTGYFKVEFVDIINTFLVEQKKAEKLILGMGYHHRDISRWCRTKVSVFFLNDRARQTVGK